MGWDGYAILPDDDVVYDKPVDHPVVVQFREAVERIKTTGLVYDWMLARGGLDVTACARAIEKMTGVGAWSNHTAREIRAMAALADAYELEDADKTEDKEWAFASAKAFLLVSAANGCSFYASY